MERPGGVDACVLYAMLCSRLDVRVDVCEETVDRSGEAVLWCYGYGQTDWSHSHCTAPLKI